MTIQMNEAIRLLQTHDNIVILTHCNPDGDTLGCGFALCLALRKLGKKAQVKNSDVIPKKYNYMCDKVEEQVFEPQYVVAVDIATEQLLGKTLHEQYAGKINLCIDHHESNTLFAEKTLVDSTAAAACELIYQLICDMGVHLDQHIANCLYTGISTDTGCFKYDNVTARTFHTGANLIDFGAESGMINRIMFDTKTKTYAKLERLAMDTLHLYLDERCAIITITQDMYLHSGSNEGETDAIASIPRQIEGVLVGVTIREKEDGTCKASIRSRGNFNASDLCKALGGGGHMQAAACTFTVGVDEAKAQLLAQIEIMLNAQSTQ